MTQRRRIAAGTLALAALWAVGGCSKKSDTGGADGSSSAADNIRFTDDARTNAALDPDALKGLAFTGVDGKAVPLAAHLGKKNVVLVITRGYAGGICLYCSTQTSRLIANYAEFRKRDAEVLVVFPVKSSADRDRWKELVKSARERIPSKSSDAPFPVLLDLDLQAVKQLDILKDLAKPSTYVFDKQGQVRFAYVGASMSDRPSIKALLSQLDSLKSQ